MEMEKDFLGLFTKIGEKFMQSVADLANAQERIQDLENTFKSLQEDNQVLSKNCKILVKQNKDLKDQLEDLRGNFSCFLEDFKKLKEENATQHQKLGKNVEVVHTRNQVMGEELNNLGFALKNLGDELEILENKSNEHFNDDIRHIRKFKGATPQNLEKASKVNQEKGHDTNKRIFRAILGYLQKAQDKTKVDMAWLVTTTGLAESTIRLAVKDLQEHKLDDFIVKKENGEYTFYDLSVSRAFIEWQKKGTFFNVPRK